MYADSVRPSAQSFPPASRAQHDLPSPSADRVVESVPKMPLLPRPAFKELPFPADEKFLRVMEKQKERVEASMRTLRIEDIRALKASDRAESQIAPQEQDLDAAGILFEVAREQHPISPALDTGDLSVTKSGGASDANASLQYTRKCPVTSCAYHLDRGLWSKTEKDNHIMTHFEGHIGFVSNENRYSLPWPNFIEDPENFFLKIEILKRRLQGYVIWDYYGGDPEDSTCYICVRNFDRSGYVEHLNDCIVHAVQAQALGTAQACPVSTCEHDPHKFPDEPMVKHFVPSLGCSRCYAIQCHCPPMQQDKATSSVDGIIRLWNDLETP